MKFKLVEQLEGYSKWIINPEDNIQLAKELYRITSEKYIPSSVYMNEVK